jgi:hypothetical protein
MLMLVGMVPLKSFAVVSAPGASKVMMLESELLAANTGNVKTVTKVSVLMNRNFVAFICLPWVMYY